MYVYLLVNIEKHIFKIGQTKHPKTRIKSLTKNFDFNFGFDCGFHTSWLVHCIDYDTSIQLEKLLHKQLENYNIRYLPKFDGSSEFFDMNCFYTAFNTFFNYPDYSDAVISMEEIISINDLPN